MSKRVQPTWQLPCAKDVPKLKLYNSLTRQKEEFVPVDGNNVKWYSCGPTVYDASHMGHARSYISFDILRRILTNYFGYNILYVMNITDIDDKIIKRARQNHLYDSYVEKNLSLEQILNDQNNVMILFKERLSKNQDPDKKIMMDNMLDKMNTAIDVLTNAVKQGDSKLIDKAKVNYLQEAKDPISDWLDNNYGNTINDNAIFNKFPKYWENEYHSDMLALNILPPDALTRVSEYIPQIINYIEKIIENKMAYESNGSVYFDVNNFDKSDYHHYAKLVPEAYGDTKILEEGEGDLCLTEDRLLEKHSPNDFALWKSSKAGEPWWDSPWGKGRPGWHIECSAMASDVCGPVLDIHTGGVDLKFPHHDNELAQSEAYFNNDDWVKYFLHTGHLTISGCKMSKSLKNFITIKDALKKNSFIQLRLAFLLHSWKDTLDYSDNTMEMAVQYEKLLNEFFLNIKDLIRRTTKATNNDINLCDDYDVWRDIENNLQEKLNQTKNDVHLALCDNVDTRTALYNIKELITFCNIYIRDNSKNNLNKFLLKKIASYITEILNIFGCINKVNNLTIGFPMSTGNDTNVDLESTIIPYVETLSEFRTKIRDNARLINATEILKLCDELRDDILPNLGVRLEDRENNEKSAVKLIDREILLKERELKKQLEEEKQLEKKRRKEELLKQQKLKEDQMKINPIDMFKNELDKYSLFDDKGLPTHDKDGKEVSKGQIKKLIKIQQAQEKRYNEYLANLNTV